MSLKTATGLAILGQLLAMAYWALLTTEVIQYTSAMGTIVNLIDRASILLFLGFIYVRQRPTASAR